MKKLILLLGIIISAIGLNAQKYNTIAGVRIADDFGLTFSQRIANKTQ
ncbi:MAG: hypothetical protein IPP49_04535 [Saprospiraceae bacterium]|nr:hypothetical protein [Saprospiraceae bacterium]